MDDLDGQLVSVAILPSREHPDVEVAEDVAGLEAVVEPRGVRAGLGVGAALQVERVAGARVAPGGRVP